LRNKILVLEQEKTTWVSILLRGARVAQPYAQVQHLHRHRPGFNPLARRAGCATKTMKTKTFATKCFNPLARRAGCATKILRLEKQYETRFNPLARRAGCATKARTPISSSRRLFQSSCEARGLRNCRWLVLRLRRRGFNPLARRAGCATVIGLTATSLRSAFQSSCEARGLRNTEYSCKVVTTEWFQSSCEARGLRNTTTWRQNSG